MNPDLIAEIRPAIRELGRGWELGRNSLCLTIAAEESEKNWIQITKENINIGLIDGETNDEVENVLKKAMLAYIEQDYEVGLFFTAGCAVNCGQGIVYLVHDLLLRHDSLGEISATITFEEL